MSTSAKQLDDKSITENESTFRITDLELWESVIGGI